MNFNKTIQQLSSLKAHRVYFAGLITIVSAQLAHKLLSNFKSTDIASSVFTTFRGFLYLIYGLKNQFRKKNFRNLLITAFLIAWCSNRFKFKKLPALFFTLVYIGNYRFSVIEAPRIRCKRTHWNVQLLEKAGLAKLKFHPIFHSYNRHLMTILWTDMGSLNLSFGPLLTFRRQNLLADDMNQIMLDWAVFDGPQLSSDSPIIFLIHGLGGDSEAAYIRRFALFARESGWRAVSYHYWRLDFAEHRDLEIAINSVMKEFPRAPIAAVGFSAGCHKLTKYLQKVGRKSPLICAVTVSGVLDLFSAYRHAKKNENRLYKMWMDVQIQNLVFRHLKYDKTMRESSKKLAMEYYHQELNSGDRLYDAVHHILMHASKKSTKTKLSSTKNYNNNNSNDSNMVRSVDTSESIKPNKIKRRRKSDVIVYNDNDYEDIENVPEWQFQKTTASHYLETAQLHMNHIETTTLMLHALDDPVVTSNSVDWDGVIQNRNIIVAQTHRGGHVGWVEGFSPFGPTWSDRVAIQFISAVLELHARNNFMLGVIREGLKHNNSESITPADMARICSSSEVPGIITNPITLTKTTSNLGSKTFSLETQLYDMIQQNKRSAVIP